MQNLYSFILFCSSFPVFYSICLVMGQALGEGTFAKAFVVCQVRGGELVCT